MLAGLPNWAGSLLNAIGEGVGFLDPEGKLLWGNEQYRELDVAVVSRIAEIVRQTPPDGAFPALELPSGDLARRFEARVTRVIDAGVAGPPRLAVVVRDVTERWRTDQKIDAIEQAGHELVRLDADVVRRLNQLERLKLLESKIVRSCRDLLRFDHFIIRLLDEKTQKLELVMTYGVAAEIVGAFDIYARAEGNGISGYVAATGRSYICTDTGTDELFLPGLAGARSSLTVPLRINDKVIGILNVESQQPAAFKDSDRRFAEIFAGYVAMAINTLGLLVVERTMTNAKVSERVEGELSEPLTDIQREVDVLRTLAQRDPELARHIERILQDVDAIRARVKECASGPQTLLGVDRAMNSAAKDPALVGRRVLIADDEPKVRQIIANVLTHYGCDVTVCESGQHAIDTLDLASRGHIPGFELLLSDIRMPDRNGYEVYSASRKLSSPPKVLLMTGFGYDPHHSIVRASQEGLQGVLFKPFQVERLLDEVRKALPPKTA